MEKGARGKEREIIKELGSRKERVHVCKRGSWEGGGEHRCQAVPSPSTASAARQTQTQQRQSQGRGVGRTLRRRTHTDPVHAVSVHVSSTKALRATCLARLWRALLHARRRARARAEDRRRARCSTILSLRAAGAQKNVFLGRRASGSLRRSVCGARADNKTQACTGCC